VTAGRAAPCSCPRRRAGRRVAAALAEPVDREFVAASRARSSSCPGGLPQPRRSEHAPTPVHPPRPRSAVRADGAAPWCWGRCDPRPVFSRASPVQVWWCARATSRVAADVRRRAARPPAHSPRAAPPSARGLHRSGPSSWPRWPPGRGHLALQRASPRPRCSAQTRAPTRTRRAPCSSRTCCRPTAMPHRLNRVHPARPTPTWNVFVGDRRVVAGAARRGVRESHRTGPRCALPNTYGMLPLLAPPLGGTRASTSCCRPTFPSMAGRASAAAGDRIG
jgi:hypothetical protein